MIENTNLTKQLSLWNVEKSLIFRAQILIYRQYSYYLHYYFLNKSKINTKSLLLVE